LQVGTAVEVEVGVGVVVVVVVAVAVGVVVAVGNRGYVETAEDMSTPVPGLYVAGDLRAKRFRQITTAVADGTIAALAAQKYVKDHR
jgi:thioredoxin reductase